MKDDRLSKKRKDPFQGMESMDRTRKPVSVFGENNSKVSMPCTRKVKEQATTLVVRSRNRIITIMQMVQGFGTVRWKVLTPKKWDIVKSGKELVPPHSGI
ncbi:unnamed protein product [Eruca vesicaria subsp. sativa]|uniref:Uncharacterized protein n=1 Tax=Eruca vesicaria subsp. sativa TaxID=29727 RepID=A0ABC8M9I7_ERUVS|nr:unnamed protein product [Eruca vesicaria subsp. sativa]